MCQPRADGDDVDRSLGVSGAVKRPDTMAGRTLLLVLVAMGLALSVTFAAVNAATWSFARTRLPALPSVDLAMADAGPPLRGPLALVALGVLILAVVLAALVSWSITRPLRGLLDEVRSTKRTGKLTPEFSENSQVREVRWLAGALNGATRSADKARAELEQSHAQFVETMAQVLDARDPYTAGHSIRVGAYSESIAIEMGLTPSEATTIRIAAELHDIGKIGLPDAVLQKPGRLTPEEFGLIKLHPQIGRKILEKIGPFAKLLSGVELHHENYDGTGYPYRLAGDQIPIAARIVHVADAFDAMVTDRAYRNARTVEAALGELRLHAGKQFDPEVVAAFLRQIARHGADGIVQAAGLAAGRPVTIGLLAEEFATSPVPR